MAALPTFITDILSSDDQLNLETLFKVAENIQTQRSSLHTKYVKWCNITKETVHSLMKLQEEIVKHNFNSNIASLSGASTSIIGCALGIAGALTAIPTAGLGLILTAAGISVGTAGGAVAAGSSITNYVLVKNLCKDAKEIFEKNTKLTEQLEKQRNEYFDLLKDFEMLLSNIPSDLLLYVYEELQQEENENLLRDLSLDDEVKESLPPRVDEMKEMKPNLTAHFPRVDKMKTNLIAHYPQVQQLTSVYYLVQQLIQFIKKDCHLYDVFNSVIKQIFSEDLQQLLASSNITNALVSIASIRSVADAGVGGIFRSAIQFSSGFKEIIKDMNIVFKIGMSVLNGIFLIVGIVDLTVTSINVHQGSISTQSKELKNVADRLEEYRTKVIEKMKEIFGWELE